MENRMTPELMKQAKSAATPESLLALAKENGIELTGEEAKAYFDQLHPRDGRIVRRGAG